MIPLRLQRQWLSDAFLKFNWFAALVGAGVTALVLGRLTETLADPDLWGYLAFGRLFWEGTGFPYADVFSYTPVKALWVYHEWLTGVVFYPLYEQLGAAGLQGLKYAAGLATAFLIYKTARLRGATAPAAIAALVLVSPLFGFAYSPVRAQIFTNLFFVLTLYLLEAARREDRPVYLCWLAPVFLLWANFHGGFVAGLGLVGLFAVGAFLSGQKARPYFLALVPASAVTLINPYGLEYWIYLKEALLMPRPDIDEWHSVLYALQYGEFTSNVIMFFILALLAALMLWAAKTRRLSDILLLGVTFFLSFRHVRHQSLFFLAMGACAPLYFTHVWAHFKAPAASADRLKMFRRILAVLFAGLLLFYGVRFITGAPFSLTLRSASGAFRADNNYPAGAVAFIRSHHVKGNILTEFSWGEYILWNLPESKVAMDGRYETVYTETSAAEYFAFARGENGWRNYLEKYPHTVILFRQESTASALVQELPDWAPVYSDADCVLFIRKEQPN